MDDLLSVDAPAGLVLGGLAQVHYLAPHDDGMGNSHRFNDALFGCGLDLDVAVFEEGLPGAVDLAGDILYALEIKLGDHTMEEVLLLYAEDALVGDDPYVEVVIQPFDEEDDPEESVVYGDEQEIDIAVWLIEECRKGDRQEQRICGERQQCQTEEHYRGRQQCDLVPAQDKSDLFIVPLAWKAVFYLGYYLLPYLLYILIGEKIVIFGHSFHKIG